MTAKSLSIGKKTQEVTEYGRGNCWQEKQIWDCGSGEESCGQELVRGIRLKGGLEDMPEEGGVRSSPVESFNGWLG